MFLCAISPKTRNHALPLYKIPGLTLSMNDPGKEWLPEPATGDPGGPGTSEAGQWQVTAAGPTGARQVH